MLDQQSTTQTPLNHHVHGALCKIRGAIRILELGSAYELQDEAVKTRRRKQAIDALIAWLKGGPRGDLGGLAWLVDPTNLRIVHRAVKPPSGTRLLTVDEVRHFMEKGRLPEHAARKPRLPRAA